MKKPIINRTSTGTTVSFNGPGGGHSSRTRSLQTPRAPRVNNNRNWINERTGQPYSGPVHYHNGRAMVGARHSNQPHDYLRPAGNGGEPVREEGPCGGLETNQSIMWNGMQYTLCPDGSCIQGAQYQCPNSRMRAPGGTGGSSY
tara:strand:+ start:895 stop:1326 length:432 start_codon:yes stop_codon:yes gene_type:complete